MAAPAGRGVLYIVWGHGVDQALERSIASVRQHHPELPVHVERLPDDTDKYQGLLEKARMAEVSPFEETLFLDVDTLVLDRLDFGFDRAARYGLACAICENPWARRHTGMRDVGDLVEYNTGVVFFGPKSRAVFARWRELVPTVVSSTIYMENGQKKIQPVEDQASFCLAVEQTGFVPYVLPHNWNFRPYFHKTFFGPLKIWHSYAQFPDAFRELNEAYRDPKKILEWHRIS
jgi:hypothetical protein